MVLRTEIDDFLPLLSRDTKEKKINRRMRRQLPITTGVDLRESGR